MRTFNSPLLDESRYQLQWSQEFDGPAGAAPDTESTWTYDLGSGSDGWGNQEHEYYTDSNARCDGNGNLIITAQRLLSEDPIAHADSRIEFYSSRLHTNKKVGFKFGRIEARIKMPKGQGSWPAFWMLGEKIGEIVWPDCGEIDIVEVGDIKNELVASLHGPGYCGADPLTNRVEVQDDLNDNFHTYAIDWLPGSVEWFFDGVSISKKTADDASAVNSEWVFDQAYFILINLAMGGVFVPGGIDPELAQAQFTIDHIRHYSIDSVGEVIKH
ncbi:MAG: glycoside hydrolase family 16 protein [Actinobacteria bacterium]|nr:glycoside hydrolase family 16 protein [Actinomycetota bacterium]